MDFGSCSAGLANQQVIVLKNVSNGNAAFNVQCILESEKHASVLLDASPTKGLILKGESEELLVSLTSFQALKLDGSSKAQVPRSYTDGHPSYAPACQLDECPSVVKVKQVDVAS